MVRVMDVDVVVVGAGMAGLSAASELRASGLDVLVVDARGRVGGRVHTLHDARTPVPVELGPELVHEGAAAVHRLVRDLSLALHELEGPTWATAATGARRRAGLVELPDFDEKVKRGLRAAFAHVPRRGDLSMHEALGMARVPEDVRDLTRFFVQGFHAGPAEKLSARALARGGPEGRGRSLRVTAGYGALAEGLAARLSGSLRLGTTVTKITSRRAEVVIEAHGPTGHGVTFRARAAVVALPLGVLRAPEGEAGAVTFDPPLEDLESSLAHLAMGQVVKITMRFREAFWTDPRHVHPSAGRASEEDTKAKLRKSAFFFDRAGPFPTFWTARPVAAPVLVAWAGGPKADVACELEPARAVEVALDGLARALNVPRRIAHDALERYFVHDWRRDPLTRGAYSYALVGGASAARAAGQAHGKTLFFAGEHTAPAPDNGTVHGAVESGRRAASEAIAALPAARRRELAQRVARGKR